MDFAAGNVGYHILLLHMFYFKEFHRQIKRRRCITSAIPL
jgi:hypothetical protein